MDSRTALVLVALTAMPGFAAGNPAKGKATFKQCSMCHNADSAQAKVGPGLKGLFKKAKLSNGQAPTDSSIRAKIDQGGQAMPKYKDILTAQEKDDLIAYLKTL